jgi:hypothetical protein
MYSGPNSLPRTLSKLKPNYTEQAKRARLQGEAVIDVIVDDKGFPNDPKFVRFQKALDEWVRTLPSPGVRGVNWL